MSGTYQSVVLSQRPKGNIEPGKTFKTQTQQAPKESDLKDGQVIIKTIYLSLDPAMRGWLNGSSFPSTYSVRAALNHRAAILK